MLNDDMLQRAKQHIRAAREVLTACDFIVPWPSSPWRKDTDGNLTILETMKESVHMYGEKLNYNPLITYLGVKLNDQAVHGIISEIHTALRFEDRLHEKVKFIINKMVAK